MIKVAQVVGCPSGVHGNGLGRPFVPKILEGEAPAEPKIFLTVGHKPDFSDVPKFFGSAGALPSRIFKNNR